MTKPLLSVTALLEAGIGVALLAAPGVPVGLLFGTALDSPAAATVGRIAGGALLSLGVACWLARNDGRSPGTKGLIAAMLLYNVATAALLGYAGAVTGLVGIGLWPGIAVHIAMAAWCIASLRTARR